ncbi:MAG: DUF1614 domain-containing protein [Gammaproteobacteria bacterium]|nr:DUF1614 domain-containing protein [Gammaproteobacteria bacterium]
MYSPRQLLFFLILLAILIVVIQFGALSLAYDKLGLSPQMALLIIGLSIFGSLVNIPLFRIKANESQPETLPFYFRGILRHAPQPFQGYTRVYANFGGCVTPVAVSLFLLQHLQLDLRAVALATILMTSISFFFSRPIHGLGIGMPIFIAPLSAAIIALTLTPEYSAPVAYISGTFGVLIGADLLRLKDIRHMGAPVASIGGAGTFDGIFITGIVAALLS